ncbi:MAG: endolytic transglycosylase MltG [Armatimonadetes bacterium]|nr:endolytic transglycosylase MltG [Armatimonadota bacterium]
MARKNTGSRRTRKPRALGLAGLILTAGVAVAWAGWYLPALRPVDPTATAPMLVQLRSGASARDFCRLLASKNLVRNEKAALIYAYLGGQRQRLKAGYYDLSASMSVPEIFTTVVEGRIATRKVVVVPGLRLEQVAERVERSGLAPATEFLRAARASAFLSETGLDIPATASLEGYLWPATYTIPVGTPAHGIALVMLEAFRDKFAERRAAEIAASGMTLHKIVTLASLVEREAKVDDERPVIAGVLLNRLRIGWKLQCDATVQYALGRHKSRLTYQDLKVASPYNTYLHAGLPPGPICMPGEASLLATLRPAKHNFLFYVARGNGRHVFTRTYAEHLAAIAAIRGGRRG